jgi:hypothetical protein
MKLLTVEEKKKCAEASSLNVSLLLLCSRVEIQNTEVEIFIQCKTELPKTMQRWGRNKLPSRRLLNGNFEMLLLFFHFNNCDLKKKRGLKA